MGNADDYKFTLYIANVKERFMYSEVKVNHLPSTKNH